MIRLMWKTYLSSALGAAFLMFIWGLFIGGVDIAIASSIGGLIGIVISYPIIYFTIRRMHGSRLF